MAKCEFCGVEFEAQRSTGKYCSPKHRTYAARERARTEKRKASIEQVLGNNAVIEQLSQLAPTTASKARAFMDEYQVECAGAIVKLCATFYTEIENKLKVEQP